MRNILKMKIMKSFLTGLAVLALSACQAFFVDDSDTSIVRFSATAGDARTKTAYSGAYSKEDGTLMELIRWVPGEDAVTIHMRCKDQNDNPIVPEHNVANYDIAAVLPENGSYISRGTISPSDGSTSLRWQGYFAGGRAHEYAHQFYSVYPKENDDITFDETDHTFTFTGLPSQNGTMNYAYMAAVKEYTEPREKNTDKVQLDYYPLVTTVYVTLTNDTGASINNFSKIITLSTSNEDAGIVGSFKVSVQDNKFSPDGESIKGTGTTISNTISADELGIGDSVGIPFFLLPRDSYSTSELTLTVGDKEYNLGGKGVASFESCLKYNIKITVSEEEPDIEEPEPLPPLSAFVNGVISAEAHKRDLNWQFGDASKGEDPNKLYCTHPDKNNAWEPVPDEKLLEIIESVVDLDINNTWEAKEITAEDLNIFPNLRTVNIDASNLESIEVNNPNITSLNVKSQTLKHVKVDGCDGLTTFTMYGNYSIKDVTVSNNENLIDFYIKSPTTNDNFYLLAENNESLTHFEIQQVDWQGIIDWNAWGLTYRFDIKNCDSFIDYKVSNNAKTW